MPGLVREPLAQASERLQTPKASTADNDKVGCFSCDGQRIKRARIVLLQIGRHPAGPIQIDVGVLSCRDHTHRTIEAIREGLCRFERTLRVRRAVQADDDVSWPASGFD